MEDSTIVSLSKWLEIHGSYRKTAAALGVPYTTVRDVVKGKHRHVSLATENHLRELLGLTPVAPLVTIPSCPDCGGAHHGRCHNKIVILRPVRKRCEPQRICEYTVGQLAMAIANRVEIE